MILVYFHTGGGEQDKLSHHDTIALQKRNKISLALTTYRISTKFFSCNWYLGLHLNTN